MPVGPAITFLSHVPAASPVHRDSGEAGIGLSAANPSLADSAGAAAAEGGGLIASDVRAADGGAGDVVEGGATAGVGVMTAKERTSNLALSPGCRRCLSCEILYDLVSSWS